MREAIAILLADLDARGKDSLIARRIRSSHDRQDDKQDKDEDTGISESTVPSLGTSFFFALAGSVTTMQEASKKKEVLWVQR